MFQCIPHLLFYLMGLQRGKGRGVEDRFLPSALGVIECVVEIASGGESPSAATVRCGVYGDGD